jgi:hypothetical protein
VGNISEGNESSGGDWKILVKEMRVLVVLEILAMLLFQNINETVPDLNESLPAENESEGKWMR